MAVGRARSPPVVIAGGGIGGLAAALGLAQKGLDVLVLEKAPQLAEIGAGIQLGPNAFHAFDYLGVGEAARRMAVYIDKLRLMDALTAEEIMHVDLGEAFRARFGNPYAVVHRGDLHRVFLTACHDQPRVELRVGSEVMAYYQDGTSVTVRLASSESVRAAAMIGADGLWSNVRKQVIGDGPPRVSGHTTYRSAIPTERMAADLRWNAATLWAGPKCHLVHYPLSGWKVFNLVITCHNDAPEPVAGKPVSKAEVMKGFAHVHEQTRKIIDLGTDWKLWVLCDREPAKKRGRRQSGPPGRRRAPDAAVHGAGRVHGDGRRRLPVPHGRGASRSHRRSPQCVSFPAAPANRPRTTAIAGHRRARLSSRGRSCATSKCGHARQNAGELVRRAAMALWQ
jgi:hypothetical protein